MFTVATNTIHIIVVLVEGGIAWPPSSLFLTPFGGSSAPSLLLSYPQMTLKTSLHVTQHCCTCLNTELFPKLLASSATLKTKGLTKASTSCSFFRPFFSFLSNNLPQICFFSQSFLFSDLKSQIQTSQIFREQNSLKITFSGAKKWINT